MGRIKTGLVNILQSVHDRHLSLGPDEINKLIESLDLIERLERKIDRLEHKRLENAKQVKALVAKNRGFKKGLRTLSNKCEFKDDLYGDFIETLVEINKVRSEGL